MANIFYSFSSFLLDFINFYKLCISTVLLSISEVISFSFYLTDRISSKPFFSAYISNLVLPLGPLTSKT